MGVGTVHQYLERAVAARDRLAVARRLERRGTGSQTIREPAVAGESSAGAAGRSVFFSVNSTDSLRERQAVAKIVADAIHY
jgi:hypothetical protein